MIRLIHPIGPSRPRHPRPTLCQVRPVRPVRLRARRATVLVRREGEGPRLIIIILYVYFHYYDYSYYYYYYCYYYVPRLENLRGPAARAAPPPGGRALACAAGRMPLVYDDGGFKFEPAPQGDAAQFLEALGLAAADADRWREQGARPRLDISVPCHIEVHSHTWYVLKCSLGDRRWRAKRRLVHLRGLSGGY